MLLDIVFNGDCLLIINKNLKLLLLDNFFVILRKKDKMIVERNDNEILVRFSTKMRTSKIQTILNYLRYKKLTTKSTATNQYVDKLLGEVKKDRWNRIKEELRLND